METIFAYADNKSLPPSRTDKVCILPDRLKLLCVLHTPYIFKCICTHTKCLFLHLPCNNIISYFLWVTKSVCLACLFVYFHFIYFWSCFVYTLTQVFCFFACSDRLFCNYLKPHLKRGILLLLVICMVTQVVYKVMERK